MKVQNDTSQDSGMSRGTKKGHRGPFGRERVLFERNHNKMSECKNGEERMQSSKKKVLEGSFIERHKKTIPLAALMRSFQCFCL